MRLFVILAIILLPSAQCRLSKTFYNFISEMFGAGMAKRLDRADLGPGGSFGGGNHTPGMPTRHQPVIIVHGTTNKASRFFEIRRYFFSRGYKDEEIYATTYGDGGRTNALSVTMECDYVKRVRELIMATSAYAGSPVDILAYSMGSPIARKAILGGRCVDRRKEHLGKPLTALVDTFVGVAGANYGSFLCIFPFGACNMQNGLHCQSSFLRDINSKKRYEGSYVFSIYSTNDDKVGYYGCGQILSNIPGQNRGIQRIGMNHDRVLIDTANIQFKMITRHTA